MHVPEEEEFKKELQGTFGGINNPRKINIEPGNDGLEDDFPLPGLHSQVPS